MRINIDHERAVEIIVAALEAGAARDGLVLPTGWAKERANNITQMLIYDEPDEEGGMIQ